MKPWSVILWVTFEGMFLTNCSLAQTCSAAWIQRYDGPANRDDLVAGMVIDIEGNIVVTGSSVGAGGSSDFATIKYTNTGIPLWTNRYSGPGIGSKQPRGIATDRNGNTFVTVTVGGTSSDILTIAYAANGLPLWTNVYDGPLNGGEDSAKGVEVDANGNVFVVGYSTGIGTNFDYVTLKYSPQGVPLWTNRFNGSGNGDDLAKAIAVDNSGNVYVTGNSWSGSSLFDFATIAYSSQGVPLWTNLYDGPPSSYDYGALVKVGPDGVVRAAGISWGGASRYDWATIAYSTNGTPLWTNRFNGSGNGDDYLTAMAIDQVGNTWVGGEGTQSLDYDGYTTIGYSQTGVGLWTNHYAGECGGSINAIVVDTAGNVIVGGGSCGFNDYADFATLAYSRDGTALWTNRYEGPGMSTDSIFAIATSGSGDVFVSGPSRGESGRYDFATIKYSLAVPISTHAQSNQLVVSWPNSAFNHTNLTFTLQSATSISGTFTNINGATSPYTNPITGTQKFFRLVSP